jgi:chromosome segregation ATPase
LLFLHFSDYRFIPLPFRQLKQQSKNDFETALQYLATEYSTRHNEVEKLRRQLQHAETSLAQANDENRAIMDQADDENRAIMDQALSGQREFFHSKIAELEKANEDLSSRLGTALYKQQSQTKVQALQATIEMLQQELAQSKDQLALLHAKIAERTKTTYRASCKPPVQIE